jgi:tryptophan 2,3-dioxygenase
MERPPLSYGDYLKIPELLSLQRLRSQPQHHDELLFIVVHQVYELWFRQILHELDASQDALGKDRVHEATRLLRRVVEIQRLLTQQVRILETMRPQDFLGFRALLNPASGFQSVQFRELEFTLGMKDAGILDALECDEESRERLRARLESPSLPDGLDRLLRRRGFPDGEGWRLAALAQVYENPELHADLNALAEVLIEIDECLGLWRAHHIQMVERMIGAKRGTGGSEGVAYLRRTLDKRAFPDLWRVRTAIGDDPA